MSYGYGFGDEERCYVLMRHAVATGQSLDRHIALEESRGLSGYINLGKASKSEIDRWAS